MPYDAVLFDLDGTLLDTETLVVSAAHAVLKSRGLLEKMEAIHQMVGHTAAQNAPLMDATFGTGPDRQQMEAEWDAAISHAFATHIPAKPHADDVLRALAAQDIPFAVATNGQSRNAFINLGTAGLGHHFTPDIVFGRDRVNRPKPAPDLFLAAAALHGADPARTLVFEDSEVGTRGALDAGMVVVQVPDQKPAQTENAHFRAATLLEGARLAGLLE